jgi:hypothetical protein
MITQMNCLLSAEPLAHDGPLAFVARFKVPHFNEMAWFPDSRRLAILSGGIRIVDTVTGDVSPPLTEQKLWPPLAISPDGSVLIVGGGVGLTLFSTQTWRKLAEIDTAEALNCRSVGHDRGIAFTPDSRFFWIGCSGPDSIHGAVKLTVSGLKIADTLNVSESTSPTGQGEVRSLCVQADPLSLRVTSVVRTSRPSPNEGQDYGYRIRLFDLASKTEFPFNLTLSPEQATASGACSDKITGNGDALLLRYPTSVTAYSIPGAEQFSPISPFPGLGVGDRRGLLSNLIPLGDDKVIAALWIESRDGGIVISDYRTGQIIQRIAAPGMNRIARAPDGTRVVGRFADELYVYSLVFDRTL